VSGPAHTFGPYRYDAGERTLYRDGEPVALAPKAIDTLHVLLERRGHVVEKADLIKLVWPDTTVEEIGLARNISLLRKALGDEAETYIQTVPRRGYRFAAGAPAPIPPAAPPAPKPARSTRWVIVGSLAAAAAIMIYWQFYLPSRYLPRGGFAGAAVIPFECLGGAPAELSREFDELLVAEMSKVPTVQVLSPSTVRRYRWFGISPAIMARVIGLDVVLEGTIQEAGGRRRVTARLADVHSGKLIWSRSFDPAEPDSRVAAEIAREAGASLGKH
jgi:DNA-binding winged helix-turn-helix (wHTH) protein/TolB-like protein